MTLVVGESSSPGSLKSGSAETRAGIFSYAHEMGTCVVKGTIKQWPRAWATVSAPPKPGRTNI